MVMSAFSLMSGRVTGPRGSSHVFLECSLDLVSLPRDRFGGHGPRPGVAAPCRGPSAGWLARAAPLSRVAPAAWLTPGGVTAGRIGEALRGGAEFRWPFMRVVHVLPAVQAGEGPVLQFGHQTADPCQLGLAHREVIFGLQHEQPRQPGETGKLGTVMSDRLL